MRSDSVRAGYEIIRLLSEKGDPTAGLPDARSSRMHFDKVSSSTPCPTSLAGFPSAEDSPSKGRKEQFCAGIVPLLLGTEGRIQQDKKLVI